MNLSRDKLLHFSISALLTIGISFWLGWIPAVGITMIIGIGKELYDGWFGTGFSIEDLLADGIGIVAGSVIYAVIGTWIW